MERHGGSKGPEMLRHAADNKLQQNADQIADRLCWETTESGNVAAATLLLDLAEEAALPAPQQRVLSLAEKWSKEPEFVPVEIVPKPMLTDGSMRAADEGEVIEGEIVEEGS